MEKVDNNEGNGINSDTSILLSPKNVFKSSLSQCSKKMEWCGKGIKILSIRFNSPKLNQNCIKIVQKLCTKIVQTLYQNSIKIVQTLYQNSIKIVSKLYKNCIEIVKNVYQNCTKIVPKLYLSCTKIVSKYM